MLSIRRHTTNRATTPKGNPGRDRSRSSNVSIQELPQGSREVSRRVRGTFRGVLASSTESRLGLLFQSLCTSRASASAVGVARVPWATACRDAALLDRACRRSESGAPTGNPQRELVARSGNDAHHGVLVRRLNAIENLGSMDVLCTDKTGTLTEGVVQVEGAYDPSGARSERALELAALNAALETGFERAGPASFLGRHAALAARDLRPPPSARLLGARCLLSLRNQCSPSTASIPCPL